MEGCDLNNREFKTAIQEKNFRYLERQFNELRNKIKKQKACLNYEIESMGKRIKQREKKRDKE